MVFWVFVVVVVVVVVVVIDVVLFFVERKKGDGLFVVVFIWYFNVIFVSLLWFEKSLSGGCFVIFAGLKKKVLLLFVHNIVLVFQL